MSGKIRPCRRPVCEVHHTASRNPKAANGPVGPRLLHNPLLLRKVGSPGPARARRTARGLGSPAGRAMGEANNDTLERGLDEAFALETRIGLQLSVSARLAAFSLLWLSFYLDAV